MAFADYDQLDQTFLSVRETANRTFPTLRASYGDGYGDFAVIGNAYGLRRWTIRGQTLGDNSRLMVGAKTAFQYWDDFIKDHTTGSKEVFIISWRSAYWSVRFTAPSFDFDINYADIMAATFQVTQARVASGLTYNADWSVNPI